MASQINAMFNDTAYSVNETTVYTPVSSTGLCRERHGEHFPDMYYLITCALCYTYVYTNYNVTVDYSTMELVTGKNTVYPEGTRMSIEPDNATSISLVCGSLLNPSECWMWQECCQDARICCQDQIAAGPKPYEDYGRTMCPRTWDGFACWPDTLAGQRPSTQCPAYLNVPDTGRKSNARQYGYKLCTENATWYINPRSHKEWTDYTECSNMEHYKRLHTVALSCNFITIFLLIPACIIFLYYRQLRRQHRIRLHVCLLVSSFMTSVSMLIWEIVIFKDTMETEARDTTTANQNSVGCRLLSMVTRYSETASFMWMFIEGFHLHRLLVHAFTVPKALIPYYIFGFGFPMLPVIAYSIVRATNSEFNQKCWISPAGDYDWIICAPSLAALLTNIVFLVRIVFIMVKQLDRHPDEPSSFRRAVKAVVMLMPLFGVQIMLFIYQPTEETSFSQLLEIIRKVFSSLQGAFIAITVCYCNKEVQGYLKTSCMKLLGKQGRKDVSSRSLTLTTQFGSEISRTRSFSGSADSSHMIALRPIYRQNTSDEPSTRETSGDFINGNLHTITENFDDNLLSSHESDYS